MKKRGRAASDLSELNFGKRKLQLSRHTYFICIPKAIVNALGLNQGTSIHFVLDVEEQTIKLHPEVVR